LENLFVARQEGRSKKAAARTGEGMPRIPLGGVGGEGFILGGCLTTAAPPCNIFLAVCGGRGE